MNGEDKNTHPYDRLIPDLVLDAVSTLGFLPTGALLSLNSYENRVYQIGMEEADPLIAKFYRPDRWSRDAILEEHLFCHELGDAEIPLIAPISIEGETLHEYEGFLFSLYPRRGGRAPESGNLEQIKRLGQLLGRLHLLGSADLFSERNEMNLGTHGQGPRNFLLEHGWIPPHLTSQYQQVTDELLSSIEDKINQVGNLNRIRIHGDFHMGNILYRDEVVYVLDFDDCCNGPRIQDIWMLFSGDRQEMAVQIDTFLQAYETFSHFPHQELSLIECFRSFRIMHYCAWLARRWADPAFPIHFPWFNTESYWQSQIGVLQEQISLLNTDSLIPL